MKLKNSNKYFFKMADEYDFLLSEAKNLFLKQVAYKYNTKEKELSDIKDNKLFKDKTMNKQTDTICCARIYSNGLGARCSKNKKDGSDFCGLHLKSELKYNRYDEEPPKNIKKMYENYLKIQNEKKNSIKSVENIKVSRELDCILCKKCKESDSDNESKLDNKSNLENKSELNDDSNSSDEYESENNSDSESDNDTDSESDNETDSESDNDTESEVDNDTESELDKEIETDSDIDSDTDTDIDSDTDYELQCNKIEIDGKYYLKEIESLNIYSIDGDNEYLGQLIDGKIK